MRSTPPDAEPPDAVTPEAVPLSPKTLNAELAFKCLSSVPLDKAGNLVLIDEIRAFVEFQSTLAYIKDPPPLLEREPVDILAELKRIKDWIRNGVFLDEWSFQTALQSILNKAHDGHLAFLPDIADVFVFRRNVTLLSVSLDGFELPRIYTAETLLSKDSPYVLSQSPVTMINGMDVNEFLEESAYDYRLHDPDARFNALLRTEGFPQPGSRYPGASTNITYENGTSVLSVNLAIPLRSFENVVDGKSFFKNLLDQKPLKTKSVHLTSDLERNEPFKRSLAGNDSSPIQGLNYTYSVNHGNALHGYHVDELNDTAILQITTFCAETIPQWPYPQTDEDGFMSTIAKFLDTSYAAGKSRLVLDLRGNMGGSVLLGLNTFWQIIPDTAPILTTRFRAHAAMGIIGREISQEYQRNGTFSGDQRAKAGDMFEDFDLNITRKTNGKPFSSWKERFGPYPLYEDYFSAPARTNWQDPTVRLRSFIDPKSYVNETRGPVFHSGQIVLLTDGICGSTCAIFSEMMKTQAGAPHVAIGGRPRLAPMQAVGGVKGAELGRAVVLQRFAEHAFKLEDPDDRLAWRNTSLATIKNATQIFRRVALGSGGDPELFVNLADHLRQNDTSQTPLEFVYEAADCRIFYTEELLNHPDKVPLVAYNVTWGGRDCVHNSTGHPSAASRAGVPWGVPWE
ncbi:hypothetical protein K402DRAFT_363373 [Aulographum hederae CBS 113979]|uniref:Uncharacterized protein n=1 Tax=Aulographum hederae CBS 113979 TaxID=1176131 RepID=A0A6G1GMP0_9PEZI|nr:hypothetical protein K402DRAFT_363373 [Aulographum hederae CBS 113979]